MNMSVSIGPRELRSVHLATKYADTTSATLVIPTKITRSTKTMRMRLALQVKRKGKGVPFVASRSTPKIGLNC